MFQSPKVVVVGSLNVDLTLRVQHIPALGETLTTSDAFTCFFWRRIRRGDIEGC